MVYSDSENRVGLQSCMPTCLLKESTIITTRRVPGEGTSSVCLICMKYRILILIIIIISLGQILLSYIANTSHTLACPRTRAHA